MMNNLSNQIDLNRLNGQMQAMQHSYGQLNAAPEPQPLSQLWHAVGRIREAAEKASSVSDAMCGAVPTSGECTRSGQPKNGGVFSEVESAADEISALATAIDVHLSRILSKI